MSRRAPEGAASLSVGRVDLQSRPVVLGRASLPRLRLRPMAPSAYGMLIRQMTVLSNRTLHLLAKWRTFALLP